MAQVQMVFVTARAGIRHSSHHNAVNAVVVITATGVGDLDLATTVWARGLVILPVIGQCDNPRAILWCDAGVRD